LHVELTLVQEVSLVVLAFIDLLLESDLLLFDLGVEDSLDITFAFLYQLFLLGC
jgi:hypothetical protein